MNPAWVSVGALLLAILLSCFTRLNIGVIALVLAWLVGAWAEIKFSAVAAGFPVQLFLTLAGMTLFFSQAQVNGTLDKLAFRAVKLCRGNAGLIPILFFLISTALASIGPGNIATAALVGPMAMAVGAQARIPAFLMAIMVGNGAGAGALSPLAPTGIIVNGVMANIGLGGAEWQTYLNNLFAHTVVAFAGYFIFGGWRLFSRGFSGAEGELPTSPELMLEGRPEALRNPARVGEDPLDWRNWVTLAVIAALIIGVVFFGLHVGMGAFAAATILSLTRVSDEAEAIRKMPWNVILMVSGVTVLISLLEKTQGMDLFADMLARLSTQESVTGVVAFVTGLISAYSSTSGVVLPAFLPTIPGLIENLGGGDPVAIASSMNVGAHLVDVSPLSTIGALCVASLGSGRNARRLFNQLLAWGMSMSVIGALACYIFFGKLGI